MPKASQLAADPRTEISWLLPTLVQFRVTGRAYIVPASGMGGSGSLSRSASLKVAPSYKSPRGPPSLRRSSSNASSLSPHPTPPLGSESSRLSPQPTPPVREDSDTSEYVSATPSGFTANPAPETPADSPAVNGGDSSSRTGFGTLPAASPTHSTAPLHLTPTPIHLHSSTSNDRAQTSPIVSAPRSPRSSPPLPGSSLSSPRQFLLRPNTPLNPAVTLGDASTNNINLPSLAGTLSALVSWGVTPMSPESSPSWWEAERARIWDSLNPALRATFARPAPPGTTLADAPASESWITRMDTHAKTPEGAKALTFAWENFAIVVLAPERVEMLELACEPHRRACWVRDGEMWVKEELVP